MSVDVADPVEEILGRLSELVDDLAELNLTALTPDGLLALLRGVETQRRRLPAHDHRLIAELDARGVAGERCCRDTKTLLRETLRLSPREATARYAAAVDLGPRRAVTGEPLPPIFPTVAAAQADGAISPEQARVITRCVQRLPAAVQLQHGPAVEQRLVGDAAHFDPDLLAKLAALITARLDPDGTLTDQQDRQRSRHAALTPNRDGTGELRAHLTPESLAMWQAVLDPLATPRPTGPDGPDTRTAGQRLHDALADCAQRLLRSGTLPDCGGTPATVLFTLTPEQAHTGHGYASTGHGGLVPVRDALHLADQASIYTVLRDTTGGILHYGRARRTASAGQRITLAARDGGCSFPGCDYPPAWCQAHHVIDWLDDGLTDTDNLTLLCGHHHRNFARRGWHVTITDGLPEWIPPPHVDPEQRPIRNTAHDPTVPPPP